MRFTCIWQVRTALCLPFTGPRFSGGDAYHVLKVFKLDLTLKYQAMLWTRERCSSIIIIFFNCLILVIWSNALGQGEAWQRVCVFWVGTLGVSHSDQTSSVFSSAWSLQLTPNLYHLYQTLMPLPNSHTHILNMCSCMPVDIHKNLWWNKPGCLSPICCWARTKML